jgi:hypothetical protein
MALHARHCTTQDCVYKHTVLCVHPGCQTAQVKHCRCTVACGLVCQTGWCEMQPLTTEMQINIRVRPIGASMPDCRDATRNPYPVKKPMVH